MEAEFQRISALHALSLADLEEELASLPVPVHVTKLEMLATTWVHAAQLGTSPPLAWDWQFCNRSGRLLAQAKTPVEKVNL